MFLCSLLSLALFLAFHALSWSRLTSFAKIFCSLWMRSAWRTPCPCPICPTYSNLSPPVPFGCIACPFPTLFSQIFVLGSHCPSHSIFGKTLLTQIFSLKYYHVEEGKQQPKFHEKTGDNCDHTLEHMGIFCLEFNSSTL